MSYKIIGRGNLGKRLHQLFTTSERDPALKCHTVFCIAVKPKDVKRVCYEIDAKDEDIVVSCAAGIKLETLEEYLPHPQIVRCMPNICVSEGSGAVIWHGNASENAVQLLENFMPGSSHVWVEDEEQLEKATTLFASQPAFQAYLGQAYMELAVQAGFSKKDAKRLYADTLIGTGKLLQKIEPNEIIKEVSSKGGTTEKGIRRLKKDAINTALKRSVFDSYMQLHRIVEKFN
jgi:pyrroline-5-carboxylate reductase